MSTPYICVTTVCGVAPGPESRGSNCYSYSVSDCVETPMQLKFFAAQPH